MDLSRRPRNVQIQSYVRLPKTKPTLAPSPLKKQLYITYVRPVPEYASTFWDPDWLTLNKLEVVQGHSARFILSNYHRTFSATTTKNSLTLLCMN